MEGVLKGGKWGGQRLKNAGCRFGVIVLLVLMILGSEGVYIKQCLELCGS